jgi:DNA-binding response OmpR family regulator
MKLHFLREDFSIISAASVAQAREALGKSDIRFVVADITNRWDDALALLDTLQERIDTSRTDVLFFDAEGSRERRLTALENGAEEVFPLDVPPGEVIGRMRRILRKEEAVRRQATLAQEDAGIQGDLAEMSLPELLQMLSMGHKTVRILLEAEELSGKVFLETGRLTHAEVGDVVGQDALVILLGLRGGRFRMSHGVTTPHRSVDRDAMSVLLDSLRTLDESRQAPAAGA